MPLSLKKRDDSEDQEDDDNNGKDDEDSSTSIFFNDFGDDSEDFVIGSSPSSADDVAAGRSSTGSTAATLLQERIQSVRQEELRKETQLTKNWQQGNWNVRGFALDPDDIVEDTLMAERQQDESPTTSRGAASRKSALDVAMGTAEPGPGEARQQQQQSPEGDKRKKIHVAHIVADVRSDDDDDDDDDEQLYRIWVARTNGDVLYIQLGSEYFTSFQSKLTAEMGDDAEDTTTDDDRGDSEEEDRFQVSIGSKLLRDDSMSKSGGMMMNSPSLDEPFEILCQFQAASQQVPLSTILSVKSDNDDQSHHLLFTAAQDGSGIIQPWRLATTNTAEETEDRRDYKVVRLPTMASAPHSDNIVALLKVSSAKHATLLCSVSRDGSLALWDVARQGAGDEKQQHQLICTCRIQLRTDETSSSSTTSEQKQHVTCAAYEDSLLYVGTDSGYVLVYRVQDLLHSDSSDQEYPFPVGQWSISSEDVAVTAVASAGPGTMGRGRNVKSSVLLTGSADGVIKQWEVLSSPSAETGDSRVQQWPKLPTQRLAKQAHLFQGHDGPITALRSMGATKFISASTDGTVRTWNPATGKELFRMDGFTEELSSLCLVDNTLITNGMKHIVCLHDFDVDPDDQGLDGDVIDDLDEEW